MSFAHAQRHNERLLRYAAYARLDTFDHRYTDNSVCANIRKSVIVNGILTQVITACRSCLLYKVSDSFENIPTRSIPSIDADHVLLSKLSLAVVNSEQNADASAQTRHRNVSGIRLNSAALLLGSHSLVTR